MAILTARRHVARWILAGLVFFLLTWQFLSSFGFPSPSTRPRHLKDPIQELKDLGTYQPPEPIHRSRPGHEAQLLELNPPKTSDESDAWQTETKGLQSILASTHSPTWTSKHTETASSGHHPTATSISDAYHLPSADAFLPHFRALIAHNNLTVTDAMKTCAWPSGSRVNFQFGADISWAEHLRNNSDIDSHRAAWQRHLLHDAIPYHTVADRFEGRGIVIVAGNERSLKRTFVLLRMLAHLDTVLPVEVHHHGDEELSLQNKTDLRNTFPNMYFSDLASPDQVIDTTAAGFINYNLKTAALLNCRFAEPLLIDSDNVPVADPVTLYTSETYREYGTIFWPDIARTRPENPIWALTNTHCRTDEYEQESGQLLVDKRKFWYHLQLAKWWSDQDYYNEFLLGDKDTFRFAWHALKTQYGRPKKWLTSVGVVQRPRDEVAFPAEVEKVSSSTGGIVKSESRMRDDEEEEEEEEERERDKKQGGGIYCGHTFGQHFPDLASSPIMFLHGGLVKTLDAPLIQHAKKYGHGLFAAYKDSPVASQSKGVEKVGIKWDGGTYLEPDVEKSLDHGAHCTDMTDVEPRPLGDSETRELEGIEKILEKAGVYWMLEGAKELE